MTIPGWGQLAPLQIRMVMLAGHPLENWSQEEPFQRQCRAIAYGRHELAKLTKKDFGFDIQRWHQYLIDYHRDHYCRSYAWSPVLPAIEDAFDNPERQHIVSYLEQPKEKLSDEAIAVAIVEQLLERDLLKEGLQGTVPVIRDVIKIHRILGQL